MNSQTPPSLTHRSGHPLGTFITTPVELESPFTCGCIQGSGSPDVQWDIWYWLEALWTVIAGEVLLVLTGWKPGMLLNILQCTRQPSQPSHPAQNASVGETGKP